MIKLDNLEETTFEECLDDYFEYKKIIRQPKKEVYLNNINMDSCLIENISFQLLKITFNNVEHCIFKDCDFSNQLFDKTVFYHCEFINCKMQGSFFDECQIQETVFRQVNGKYINWVNVKSKKVNFDSNDFSDARFMDCEFNKLNILSTNFQSSEFINSKMSDADFSNSNIAKLIVTIQI